MQTKVIAEASEDISNHSQAADEPEDTWGPENTASETEVSEYSESHFERVVAGTFVAGDVHEVHFDEDRLIALRLHKKTVLRIRDFFHPPPHYKDLLVQAFHSNERILIVQGPEHSGKLTCGIKLACDLRGKDGHEAPIYLYRRRSDESRSLIEALQSEQVPESSTLILEDAFQTNISRRELQSPDIDSLRAAARERDLILILTTELDSGELIALSGTKITTKGLHLEKVLGKHLKSAQLQTAGLLSDDLVKRILSRWPDLRMALRNPSQIERFCDKVIEAPPRENSDIDRLARQAALVGQRALREWFGQLGSNEKLFAMLAYLFGGAEHSILEDMHAVSINMLRAEGLSKISDPRELGFEDLVDAIQAQELGGFIEFKDESFAEEIAQQLSSWGQLLRFIIDGLLTSVGPNASPDLRRALGIALGRLPTNSRSRIDELIDGLASHQAAKIAVIAGSALEERVRRNLEIQGPLVVRRIRDWIHSGEPERMWAAGAAVRRVYSATKGVPPELNTAAASLQESLVALLGQLIKKSDTFADAVKRRVENDIHDKLRAQAGEGELDKKLVAESVQKRIRSLGYFNRECAAEAARKICLMDPSKSYILGEWLRERGTREVARDATLELFKVLTTPRFRLSETRHAPFLDLIGPVLESVGQGKNDAQLVGQIFAALASRLKGGEWHNQVAKALLGVANRGSGGARRRLRAALSQSWLHDEAEVREIARVVIARSYSMDGILIDRPQLGKGALVIDPAFLKSEDEETRQQKMGACRHLFGLLDSHFDVELIFLGTRLSPLDSTSLHPPFARLLMPALETTGLQHPRFVLVLSRDVIPDLEDALAQHWGKNLLLITTDAETTLEGLDIIHIRETGWSDLSTVEEKLHARWAEALALAGPQDWMETLESFGIGKTITRDPITFLDTQVAGLSEPESATGHNDLARQLLCAICWYGASDLLRCAEHLRNWITEQPEGYSSRNLMGIAGAKVLFRIHEAHCPSYDNPAPKILFETLAYALAEQDKDGVDSVLHAVRCWMKDPLWAAYLAGEVENGKGRLLRWAEKLAPQHVQALKAALPKTPEIPTGKADDVREELSALLDRVRLWIARGRPKVLPVLGYGESYALLVLDASEPDGQSRNNLAKLAGSLFARLSRSAAHGIKPIIYRLGERQPCWVSGDPAPPPEELLPKQPESPSLLGPIISNELSPATVRLLLLLSNRFPLDGEDYVETGWRERIFVWRSSTAEEGNPAFALLPDFAEPERDLPIEKILLTSTQRCEDAQG